MAHPRTGWRAHPIMVELRRLGLLIILGHAILFSGIILGYWSLELIAISIMSLALLLAVARVGLRRFGRQSAAADAVVDDA